MGKSIAMKYLSAGIGGNHMDLIQLASKTSNPFTVLATNLPITTRINQNVYQVGIQIDEKHKAKTITVGAIVISVQQEGYRKIPLFLEIEFWVQEGAKIRLEEVSVPPKHGLRLYTDGIEIEIEGKCFTTLKETTYDSYYIENPNLIIQYLYDEITTDDLRAAAIQTETKKQQELDEQVKHIAMEQRIELLERREKIAHGLLQYLVSSTEVIWWKSVWIKDAIQRTKIFLNELRIKRESGN